MQHILLYIKKKDDTLVRNLVKLLKTVKGYLNDEQSSRTPRYEYDPKAPNVLALVDAGDC